MGSLWILLGLTNVHLGGVVNAEGRNGEKMEKELENEHNEQRLGRMGRKLGRKDGRERRRDSLVMKPLQNGNVKKEWMG